MKSKLKIIIVCAIFVAFIGITIGSVVLLRNTLSKNRKSEESSQTLISGDESTSSDSQGSLSSSDPAVSSDDPNTPSGGESTIPDPSSADPTTSSGATGTLMGNGVEGTPGTGNYNYGEALQKSLLFYELQRSGDLPDATRCNWRGDSCLKDGADVGLDLTGGWFDAGDNVKFNLPMAYTATMLGWSVYEDMDAYVESNQLEYALANIRWANEYFIRCHPEAEVYYYQVGDGNADHTWWGAGECVEYRMNRPSYKVDANNPGSAVTAETAASLAVCSILYKDIDPDFSALCLEHATSLYAFADKYKSDAGYTAANGFYNSWSGFYDELSWAAVWLYRATGDASYLQKAKDYYPKANQDYDWALCWDDVHIGAAILLAMETGESTYTTAVENHLDFWTTGFGGKRITYTPKGLAWLDSWDSLRYATTTAYVAAVYSEWDGCPSAKKDVYWDFAVAQAGYVLGDTGFSYMIGFGDNYPHNPHHRTAQGSYCDNMNTPSEARHILVGALVGGPDASDGYTDEVSNYQTNEVACDYNAGFTGLLAKLYSRYKGQTLTGFGCCEIPGEEYRVEASLNAGGSDFAEVKALVYNMTAWPARSPENLELRYYFELPAGTDVGSLSLSTNYMQNATANGIFAVDGNDAWAFVSVVYDAHSCYPGGQDQYKKEVQFRIAGVPQSITDSASPCLYENGVLVFGTEPAGAGSGSVTPAPGAPTPTPAPTATPAPTPKPGDVNLSVTAEYNQGKSGTGNAIAVNLTIENTGDKDVSLSALTIEYYFTNDNGAQMAFDCYHAAINRKDGKYEELSSVAGAFAAVDPKKDKADTCCTISGFGSTTLKKGDKMVVQISLHHDDWSNFDLGNDYSTESTDHIVLKSSGAVVYGVEP